jgi:pre-mRNA-splicing helicase BRR2
VYLDLVLPKAHAEPRGTSIAHARNEFGANRQFYNLQGTTPTHIADYLSELVESTISDLLESNCIEEGDEDDDEDLIKGSNLGMVASYYYISYVTVETFNASIKETTKLKGVLEIVSSANEFESIPIRHHEDTILSRIYDRVPVKVAKADYSSPYFKTYLLLQAHFSRMSLPPDLAIDQATVLGKVTGLLSACVDVMSTKGTMNCLGAMDLSQMCVQAIWDRDSPLKQVPYFDEDVLGRFKDAKLDSVYDIMELEDDQRNDLLRMSDRQL